MVWLAPENCFRAYRRLPGSCRDTALSAATSGEMADLIGQISAVASTLRGVYPQDPDTNIYPENWYFVK